MSETKENLCPECGHPRFCHPTINKKGTCGAGSCGCIRSYESLVGEKIKATECDCVNWSVTEYAEWEASRYGQHHPNCDGRGNHVPLPPESAKYEQVAMCPKCDGVLNPKVSCCCDRGGISAKPAAVDEPELQLLVIDMGDCCVVKVEKGNFDWSYCIKGGCFRAEVGAVRVHDSSFPELRSAIDGEKPVPRIETELNQSGYTDYILRYKDGDTICVQFLTQSQFTTLSELAGKPLPIYECGKWERLDGKFNPMDAYGELPVKVWRYRRD